MDPGSAAEEAFASENADDEAMSVRRRRSSLALGLGPLLVALAVPVGGATADVVESPPVLVYLADGTSLPLRDWSLSYEYVTWEQGSDPALATTHRRDARELWVGKKTVATGGLTLEIRREPGQRDQLALAFGAGKKEDVKAEPPGRDLLAPEIPRGVLVVARTLDLRGETLTATKRELCLLAYTRLVECGQEADQRVVRIEFPN